MQVEAYPDLKANQNFLQLQEELSDIENKLAAARRFFNGATTEYNNAVESFPGNLIARNFGFKREIFFDLGDRYHANKWKSHLKFNFSSDNQPCESDIDHVLISSSLKASLQASSCNTSALVIK